MATRISQQQLNKFISPEAAMAPYNRAQESKESALQRDAALRNLITGKEMDETGRVAGDARQAQMRQEAIDANVGRANAQATASGMKPGKYSINAGEGSFSVNPESSFPGIGTLLGLTPGQEATDKDFGKDYSEYHAQGGNAGMKKNLQTVEEAVKDIENQDIWDQATGHLPDWARGVVGPTGLAREQNLKGAVQGTMKQTLGAQFTEKEGKRVEDRAYDPRLSKEENIRRASKIANELRAQAAQKDAAAKHFQRYGTLKGFNAVNAAVSSDPGPLETKVINGVTYEKVQGGWKKAQ